MEREGIAKSPIKVRDKLKVWHLIVVLLLLLIVIIGLVIWIVYNANNGKQGDVACEEMEDRYEIISCLSNEEPSETLEQRYDAVIERAFEEEDYMLFDGVIFDRTTGLISGEKCEESFSWLETLEQKYAGRLPIIDLYGFYVSGVEAALECENSEKQAYYQSKVREILSSEEYAKAIAENDYRVYGVDIPEGGEEDGYDE